MNTVIVYLLLSIGASMQVTKVEQFPTQAACDNARNQVWGLEHKLHYHYSTLLCAKAEVAK